MRPARICFRRWHKFGVAQKGCALHSEPQKHTFARNKPCETETLDAELQRFRDHHTKGDVNAYILKALSKHRFRLPHRDRFPDLSNRSQEKWISKILIHVGARRPSIAFAGR